ncbi:MULTISPECIES: DsbA family protein [unclassified Streptomyces]|uniref:DsbA family protein n=1 Tax=unclassified Streptomyces TaxID=2593676 RepID=UPI000DC77C8F|nr:MULTISPECIES: DsbA family protein [unclassified Streptomyces]AWZ04226.1 DsbA family protein [Streptomyces sp. ICC4]AWZ11836.1 DsbA family protein [Streptomyces sp. ICC1]
MKLVYVFDAYCGWSYGFAPTLAEVTLRHPELPVEVVSGGLFTGQRAVPIREFGYVQGANAKISELTGVGFGAGYERLIADGSFVMDSQDAARGTAALRQAAPERAVELAMAVQAAFYQDGLSLSDPETFTRIAAAAGLDALEVGSALAAPATSLAAEADFRRAAALGANAYPTLLVQDGDRTAVLAVGHAGPDKIDTLLEQFGAARTRSAASGR